MSPVESQQRVVSEALAALPELDTRMYTESECFCAGRMSTLPPFDKLHPSVCLPYARAVLEALGDWEPSE